MKVSFHFILFAFVSSIGFSLTLKDGELPLPNAKQSTYKLKHIIDLADVLEDRLGEYPPDIKSDSDRRNLYERWSIVYSDVAARLDQKPEDDFLLYLLAKVLRQGHNLNVVPAGRDALTVTGKCLNIHPKSFRCHRAAMFTYLSIPGQLPEAKKSLDFLRAYYAPKVDESTEVSYALYYKVTDQKDEAKKQIDYILQRFPTTHRKEKLINFKAKIDTSPVRIVK